MAKKKKENRRGLLVGAALLLFLMSRSGKAAGTGTVSSTQLTSQYYNLSDVQRSQTALDENITEQFAPLSPEVIRAANYLTSTLLDPLTKKLGSKLEIDSWHRVPATNTAVGGSVTSFHLTGGTVDIDFFKDGVLDNRMIVAAIIKYDYPYTEMIVYGDLNNPSEVHVAAIEGRPEKELLHKNSSGDYIPIDEQTLFQNYYDQGVRV